MKSSNALHQSPLCIVAGGGTGGHINAGLSILQEWKKKFPNGHTLFVGAKGGLEELLVPKSHHRLVLLKVFPLKGKSILAKIRSLISLPLSFLSALRLIFRSKPACIIGVGGYASGPFLLAARFSKLWFPRSSMRTAILEQNAIPGFTNRSLALWVDQIFCAFSTPAFARVKAPVHVCGNPIRDTFKPHPSRANVKPFKILVFGGSQGAVGINRLMTKVVPMIRSKNLPIQVLHQTGEKDYETTLSNYSQEDFKTVKVEKYLFEITSEFEAAALIICRAGSSTLSELARVRRAAILIPFPYAADNHQEKNARLFEKSDAAYCMLQQSTSPEDLMKAIEDLYKNPDRIHQMEENVSKFDHANAAAEIVLTMQPSEMKL